MNMRFDYDKIPSKVFSIQLDEYITEFLFFEKGYVIRKHEEYFNDWSVRISVEEFWQQKETLLTTFAPYNAEILTMLENALIK